MGGVAGQCRPGHWRCRWRRGPRSDGDHGRIDGDGVAAAGAFGAKLDAAGGAVAVVGGEAAGGVSLVENGAGVVATYSVIFDQYIF